MSISYGRVRGPGYDARTGKVRYKYAQGASKKKKGVGQDSYICLKIHPLVIIISIL